MYRQTYFCAARQIVNRLYFCIAIAVIALRVSYILLLFVTIIFELHAAVIDTRHVVGMAQLIEHGRAPSPLIEATQRTVESDCDRTQLAKVSLRIHFVRITLQVSFRARSIGTVDLRKFGDLPYSHLNYRVQLRLLVGSAALTTPNELEPYLYSY